MATLASSLRLRICFAALTVSALLIGRAAAIPHAHGGGADEARHAGLPPHFHLSWLYESGSDSRRARHGGELRPDATPAGTGRSATNDRAGLESDAVYLVEVGEPPVRVDAARLTASQASFESPARSDSAWRIAGAYAPGSPPFEPDATDLYLLVRRIRI